MVGFLSDLQTFVMQLHFYICRITIVLQFWKKEHIDKHFNLINGLYYINGYLLQQVCMCLFDIELFWTFQTYYSQGSYVVGIKLITMGKSPGKWLRSLLPGKKSSKSGTSKVGDTIQFCIELNYPSGSAFCLLSACFIVKWICPYFTLVCQELKASFVLLLVRNCYYFIVQWIHKLVANFLLLLEQNWVRFILRNVKLLPLEFSSSHQEQ